MEADGGTDFVDLIWLWIVGFLDLVSFMMVGFCVGIVVWWDDKHDNECFFFWEWIC